MKEADIGVMEVYGHLVDDQRLCYPTDRVQVNTLIERIASLRRTGARIVICDGGFDVPTDNHVWWLRDCRYHATERIYGPSFARAGTREKIAMIASSRLALVLTLDADVKVAERKAHNPAKGGIARPVYDWTARANRVAGHMIPNGFGFYRPAVDLVTVEGDPALYGTCLESHITFGNQLARMGLLDYWVLNSDHTGIHRAQAHRNQLIVIDKVAYATDARTGEMWSSTYVINRIRGEVRAAPPSQDGNAL
jgi:hypothetical protein